MICSHLFSILSSGRIQTLDEISCMSKEHCITGSTTYHWQHCQPQISHTLRVIHILRKHIFRPFWLLSTVCCFEVRAGVILCARQLWRYGLWNFKMGCLKLEICFLKNQHTLRKFLNFENWTNGEGSKSAKSPNLLTFKVNFLCQKLSESFSIFSSLKNINLRAQFLLLAFFENFNL